MSRPAPRRSSLAGSTPVTPPVQPQDAPAPVPPTEPAVPGQAPAAAAPAPRRPAAVTPPPPTPTKSKYPPKVSFYQDPADTARVRGALLHTQVSEGTRSLSQFIHQAVMAEVERLEHRYNDGEPFPPVAPRALPQGRPMSG